MTGLAPSFKLPEGVTDPMAPIGSHDELVAYFRAGVKPGATGLLGVEYERLPVTPDGQAAPFRGEGSSVQCLLKHLAELPEWTGQEAEGYLLGLEGAGGANVHLEPGGQAELALEPHRTAVAVLKGLEEWRVDLRRVADACGIRVLALGLQPLTPIPDIGWVPKERYRIMREHLGARGALAHHMMKASAGWQLNLDVTSEEDAAGLMETALAVSPLVNAFCLNSPLEEGKPNGYLSKRPRIWLETDPARCGLLPWVLDEGFSFERYTEWALQAGVMFVQRGEDWRVVGDKNFTQLIDSPGDLGPITLMDWHLHLTTLFPEVRIKQHAEVRGMDCCRIELIGGACALWRGLLYDETGRRDSRALVEGLDAAERQQFHEDVGRIGLKAQAKGRSVRDLCSDLLDIAEAAVKRLPDGEADAALLAPLREVVRTGRTPAEDLLDDYARDGLAALLSRG